MNKLAKRKVSKTAAIAKALIDGSIKSSGLPNSLGILAHHQFVNKAIAINETPAHLFRTDKPELDKRRLARFNRKMFASSKAYLIDVDAGESAPMIDIEVKL